MKPSFKTIFVMISAIVVGYALHDYQKNDMRSAERETRNLVLPGMTYENVQQIRVRRAMGELVLTQTTQVVGAQIERHWQLEKPLLDRAGVQESVNFFNSISNLSLKPAGVEGEIRWAQYGLEKPEAELEIDYTDNEQKKTLKLEFGSERNIEGGFYVRRNGAHELLVSSVDWTPLLLILADDLRDKNILPLRGSISKVEMLDTKNTWTLQYQSEKWILSSFEKVIDNPTAKTIQDFARELRDFKAERLLEPTSQKSPSVFAIKVKTSAPDEEFTISFHEQGRRFYAISSARPVVFEISKDSFNSIRKTASYFTTSEPETSK